MLTRSGKLRQWRKTPLREIERFAGLVIVPVLFGRLDRERTADLAIPKTGVRHRDDGILKWARRLSICDLCNRPRKTEPHHLKSVGAGGSDDCILAVCRECHRKCHGGKFGRRFLMDLFLKKAGFC